MTTARYQGKPNQPTVMGGYSLTLRPDDADALAWDLRMLEGHLSARPELVNPEDLRRVAATLRARAERLLVEGRPVLAAHQQREKRLRIHLLGVDTVLKAAVRHGLDPDDPHPDTYRTVAEELEAAADWIAELRALLVADWTQPTSR